ncbi:hypothetical protein AGOR_G00151020 [Albula goreensis]|uniref:Uncharacterized protein n=1 Tax=Albula goreensis TaxID=1534307 RepID=A0A8T3D7M0_9TELE|nr:hypothetical protein AGOR_G00151020 [Albula goreensis]
MQDCFSQLEIEIAELKEGRLMDSDLIQQLRAELGCSPRCNKGGLAVPVRSYRGSFQLRVIQICVDQREPSTTTVLLLIACRLKVHHQMWKE